MLETEEILSKLKIPVEEVLNVYLYGSQVYGCITSESDHDYVIVQKRSLLPSGAFRDNAISSDDRKIQGVCYSRGGFIDAINNYEIRAMECIFAPDNAVLQKKMNFGMTKYTEKDMVKKVIEKASNSWHIAHLCNYEHDDIEHARKGVYQAIRILMFGLQIKETSKIHNFSEANEFKQLVTNDVFFNVKKYVFYRDELMHKLRK